MPEPGARVRVVVRPNVRVRSAAGSHNGAALGGWSRCGVWHTPHVSPADQDFLLKSCFDPSRPPQARPPATARVTITANATIAADALIIGLLVKTLRRGW